MPHKLRTGRLHASYKHGVGPVLRQSEADPHKWSAAEGHIAERRRRASGSMCSRASLMRGRGTSDKRSGDAINGGTPPGVSDLADLPDGVPDKRGGDLLSHPFGQYHRRGRA